MYTRKLQVQIVRRKHEVTIDLGQTPETIVVDLKHVPTDAVLQYVETGISGDTLTLTFQNEQTVTEVPDGVDD